MQPGRDREVAEIIRHDRAVEVGRLLLGELDGPMRPIFPEDYREIPRRQLKSGMHSLRDGRRDEVTRFCKRNFKNVGLNKLAHLYEPLYSHGGVWRLPLTEFIQQLGEPREDVLRDAPLHSTVVLSGLWGLQFEFPEAHLMKDIAIAFNTSLFVETALIPYKMIPLLKIKEIETRRLVADLQRQGAASRRSCVISCFNLLEAYINGIAWAYVQKNDISALSNKKQEILTEGQGSILDKLVRIPQIVKNQLTGPLHQASDPLKTFKEMIKPFRDSIVHASPFSASERYGGYDKLSKIYELSIITVNVAIDNTIEIISKIHQFVGGRDLFPQWVLARKDDGSFDMDIV